MATPCYIIQTQKDGTNQLEVFSIGKEKEMLDRITELTGPLDPPSKELAGRIIDKKLEAFPQIKNNLSTQRLGSHNMYLPIYIGVFGDKRVV